MKSIGGMKYTAMAMAKSRVDRGGGECARVGSARRRCR